MKTVKKIMPVVPNDNYHFYLHEKGSVWSLYFKDEDGKNRFLICCYLEKENNRGWTFRLAYSIASSQPKAFLSRGEWQLVE